MEKCRNGQGLLLVDPRCFGPHADIYKLPAGSKASRHCFKLPSFWYFQQLLETIRMHLPYRALAHWSYMGCLLEGYRALYNPTAPCTCMACTWYLRWLPYPHLGAQAYTRHGYFEPFTWCTNDAYLRLQNVDSTNKTKLPGALGR